MLNQLIDNLRWLGVAQAAVSSVLVLILVLIARRRDIHIETETLIAMIRGVAQVVAVGSVLLFLTRQPTWTSTFALLAMLIAATFMGANRVEDIPGTRWVCFLGIGLGAGSVIVTMTLVGVIVWEPETVIPVGSMLIANAMNTVALALDRFRSEILSHVGEIETALALGAEPKTAVKRYVQAAIEASLIPRINSLRSLGIVWIPGAMTGMVLSGSDPVYAALYQFVIIAMIFASAGLTSLFSILLVRTRVFSPAMQLLLQPKSVAGEG
jgi:putative ABC transport system permease protein